MRCLVRTDQQARFRRFRVDHGHAADLGRTLLIRLHLRLRHVWLRCLPGVVTRTGGCLLGFAPCLVLCRGRLNQDALVVLGMLQEVFRRHPIARGLRIARQGNVFVDDLLRRTTDFAFGARAVVDAVDIVAAAATATFAVAAPARPVRFLCWSHPASIFC